MGRELWVSERGGGSGSRRMPRRFDGVGSVVRLVQILGRSLKSHDPPKGFDRAVNVIDSGLESFDQAFERVETLGEFEKISRCNGHDETP